MILKYLGAFLLGLLVSAGFGGFYIPWLKKKKATQPLKKEVAQIYSENRISEDKPEG